MEIRYYPFSGGLIDIVVENAIQAHEDQCILSQPNDCFLRAGHSGDYQYERTACNGG